MPKLQSPEQEDFENTVRHIRSSCNYLKSLDDVRLKLELPDSIKRFEIEALLIHATREQFDESLDADMALMALGLLKGFANPRNSSEDRSGIKLITERRRMFIEKSSYVADRHNHTNKRRTRYYESYEELEAAGEDAINAVISALGSEDGNDIDDVAQKLYSKRNNIDKFRDESKKYLIYDKKNNPIDVKLQDLKCIRQKTNDILVQSTISETKLQENNIEGSTIDSVLQDESAQESSEENTDDSNQCTSEEDKDSNNTVEKDKIESEDGEGGETVPPQPDPLPEPSKPKPKINIKDILLVITVSTICITLLRAIIINNNVEVKNSSTTEAVEDARNQKAQKITILNKDNLQLHLGEKAYIAVETDPLKLNPHELLYVSSAPSVVAVKNINDGQVEAAKQLADGVENRSDIVVLDADSGIQDSITIFVDSLESRASEGKGGNNSSYDGEAQ